MKAIYLIIIMACTLAANSQYTLIPDTVFERRLIDLNYDSGVPDGHVLTAAIDTVKWLPLENYSSNSTLISDLTGIEDFAALETLLCYNLNCTSIDLGNNTHLKTFSCGAAQYLSNINFNGADSLEDIIVIYTALTSVEVSNNTLLKNLNCNFNNIAAIDLSSNILLESFSCSACDLTTLDVSQHINLTYLHCGSTPLTTLNINGSNAIHELNVSGSNITTLNLSNLTDLEILDCSYCSLLECLNIRNSIYYYFSLYAQNTPNLYCIEVMDSLQAATIWESYIDQQATFSESCNNSCSGAASVEDLYVKERELISVTDLLGRPTKVVSDKVLIYRYSDGTTEKKILFEE